MNNLSQEKLLYKKLIKLVEFLEYENSKCKYDDNEIPKRIILKDILYRLHELRQIAK
ncbi:hypothetical protein [Aliarcobacter cryaerophilus]|uniref:hypothetical protein n=1 Tax=Aliarcobacter cryaerophilus TaxID=28198 RepID=UPI000A8EFB64|nr:hypothetical protein [Aliarcobacter cryaerophilus]MCT7445195.1 hypothetical protein [Aliarcobacter cryaerophilus]MCT7480024.1 hypothetical protein [Aliarcobacter cryaerophilus]MCT7508299.1 hypothetical protein [Aliarcobacter cryaerophilus]MCT7526942.1 hypothetical protein [Aliarcobacter cryaerophilus]MCT7533441.1 hypothetical protein [Aliarcobacter cryaerophilus]